MERATAGSLASLGGESMGTRWSVRLYARPGTDLHVLHAGIQQQLDRVVAQMSTWRMDSDISRYRHAPAPARLRLGEGGQGRLEFDAPQRAITPGQSVVFYRGSRLLGGARLARVGRADRASEGLQATRAG